MTLDLRFIGLPIRSPILTNRHRKTDQNGTYLQ